jgi:hypothetical protein
LRPPERDSVAKANGVPWGSHETAHPFVKYGVVSLCSVQVDPLESRLTGKQREQFLANKAPKCEWLLGRNGYNLLEELLKIVLSFELIATERPRYSLRKDGSIKTQDVRHSGKVRDGFDHAQKLKAFSHVESVCVVDKDDNPSAGQPICNGAKIADDLSLERFERRLVL